MRGPLTTLLCKYFIDIIRNSAYVVVWICVSYTMHIIIVNKLFTPRMNGVNVLQCRSCKMNNIREEIKCFTRALLWKRRKRGEKNNSRRNLQHVKRTHCNGSYLSVHFNFSSRCRSNNFWFNTPERRTEADEINTVLANISNVPTHHGDDDGETLRRFYAGNNTL